MVDVLPLSVLSELRVLDSLFMLSERSSQYHIHEMIFKLSSEDYSTVCRILLDRIVKTHPSRLTDELLNALVNSGSKYINVSNCSKVTAAGFKQLLHRCTSVEVLNLTGLDDLTSPAFMCDLVLATFAARTLTCLVLDNTSILSEVVQCLICLPNLRQLSLAQCKNINNDAFFCPCDSVRLSSVNVAGCRGVTTLGIAQLTKLCGPTLQYLNISGSGADYMAFFFIAGLRLSTGKVAWVDENFASDCQQTAASGDRLVAASNDLETSVSDGNPMPRTVTVSANEVESEGFLTDSLTLKAMLLMESVCESKSAQRFTQARPDQCDENIEDMCRTLPSCPTDSVGDVLAISGLEPTSCTSCGISGSQEVNAVSVQRPQAFDCPVDGSCAYSSVTCGNNDSNGEDVNKCGSAISAGVDASCNIIGPHADGAKLDDNTISAKVTSSDSDLVLQDLVDDCTSSKLNEDDQINRLVTQQNKEASSSSTAESDKNQRVLVRVVDLYKPVLVSLEANDLKFADMGFERFCLRMFASRNERLKNLSLSWDGINDEFLECLSKHTSQLRSLQLWGGASVTSTGLASLAVGCKQLTDLNISGLTFVDDSGLLPLIQLGSLEKLDMSSTEITDVTLHTLASESSRYLQELSISWCDNITTDGLLSVSRHCCALRKLCMRQMPTTGYMVALMAERCRQLAELNLSCVVELDDSSLAVIAQNLKQLQVLDISWNEDVTDVGLSSLLLYCPRLRTMCLCGLKRITSKPFLPIIADYVSWRRCQALLHLKRVEQQTLDASELGLSSDEEYEDLCLPHRSTTYACCLAYLELDYCDLIDDKHFNEIVAVCRGTLQVVDYYHQIVEPIWVTYRPGVFETFSS